MTRTRNPTSIHEAEHPPKLPFAEEENARSFFESLVKELIGRMDKLRTRQVSESNIQVFVHGRGWTFQQEREGGFASQAGEVEKESVPSTISLDRIIAHDVRLAEEFIHDLSTGLTEGMARRVHSAFAEVASEPGNEVKLPKGAGFEKAFLQALRSMHFNLLPDGTIAPPIFFCDDADTRVRIARLETEADPSFRKEFEELWEQKKIEATERERARMERYNTF